MHWLIEPLQYTFFLKGLVSGLIVAITCGSLSAFIVWRGMSFIGDALAHSILPGIVVAVMLGVNMLLGALGAAVISVFAIGALTNLKGFKDDTAIGVIFTGTFALGIILMNKVASFKDLTHVLFGNILGVSSFDLILIAIVGFIVVLLVVLFFKELLVTSFDSIHATAIGLSPKLINYGLLLMIAATTVIAAQTVGVVLVLALLVTPAATASLLVKKLKRIITLSVIFSALSVIIGFYSSYYFDLATGASIVMVLTVFFMMAFGFVRVRNVLVNRKITAG